MHYVKVEKGRVVDGPKILSGSESASPNVHWGADQLKANGWFPVDLTHDFMVEKIDYDNPIINGDSIEYKRIPLDEQKKKDIWNQEALKNRLMEYDKHGCSIENLTVALWEMIVENRPEQSVEIQAKRELIKAKYYKR